MLRQLPVRLPVGAFAGTMPADGDAAGGLTP